MDQSRVISQRSFWARGNTVHPQLSESLGAEGGSDV